MGKIFVGKTKKAIAWTIILSIIVFSADKVDWAGAYLVGLLFVMLFLHIRYNIRKS